jgi:hypothetical protein
MTNVISVNAVPLKAAGRLKRGCEARLTAVGCQPYRLNVPPRAFGVLLEFKHERHQHKQVPERVGNFEAQFRQTQILTAN